MIPLANILIVEDEKAMQDIIVDYMRKGGHTCFTAGDGIDALVMLKNHPMASCLRTARGRSAAMWF